MKRSKEANAKMIATRKSRQAVRLARVPQAIAHLRYAVSQIRDKEPVELTNMELAVILAFKALTEV